MQELHRLALDARNRGNRPDARASLDKALALDPDCKSPALLLLHAELLLADGETERADAVLNTLCIRHPGFIWAPVARAIQAHRLGDIAAAQRYLDNALALDPDMAHPAVHLLHATLLEKAGRTAAAETVLASLQKVCPDNAQIHLDLARLAKTRNDPVAARRHLEAALDLEPQRLEVHLSQIELLMQTDGPGSAATRLASLHEQYPQDMRILTRLMNANRLSGNMQGELACFADAIRKDPYHPDLLQYVFSTHARWMAPGLRGPVMDMLRDGVSDALADRLETWLLVQTEQFDAALRLIRKTRRAQRTLIEARDLVAVLFGTHKICLGWRYLQACLQRWPTDTVLLSHFVTQGLRLGKADQVALRIKASASHLPEHAILSHRFMLHGYLGNLDAVVAIYERLAALNQATQHHRNILSRLIFTLLNPIEADALFDRIGHIETAEIYPHSLSTLLGQQRMEFDLERIAWEASGPFADPRAWGDERPQTTVAAIHTVDAWRKGSQEEMTDTDIPELGPIPRQIFQYWESAFPPPEVTEMTASWARAPGFGHRILDRAGVVKILRDTMGPRWVAAFRMALNTTEESDFFRLCVLARSGGVWANADSILYGDLDRLLGQGRGLLLYREPSGGVVGNTFIAAPKEHPVLLRAARLARNALLQRSSESAWNKTGPGLMTRALAHYLVHTDAVQAHRQITVLDWPRIGREIATDCPAAYKTAASQPYWDKIPMPGKKFWDPLHAALLGRRVAA